MIKLDNTSSTDTPNISNTLIDLLTPHITCIQEECTQLDISTITNWKDIPIFERFKRGIEPSSYELANTMLLSCSCNKPLILGGLLLFCEETKYQPDVTGRNTFFIHYNYDLNNHCKLIQYYCPGMNIMTACAVVDSLGCLRIAHLYMKKIRENKIDTIKIQDIGTFTTIAPIKHLYFRDKRSVVLMGTPLAAACLAISPNAVEELLSRCPEALDILTTVEERGGGASRRPTAIHRGFKDYSRVSCLHLVLIAHENNKYGNISSVKRIVCRLLETATSRSNTLDILIHTHTHTHTHTTIKHTYTQR
eukprot:GHVR01053985.1.p1 GENE.GHVR01053985.1~~GHVR01053985.1.p1  ORF type:complete len:320 (+),score=88.70 GHVR01053985.1:45-962(+)